MEEKKSKSVIAWIIIGIVVIAGGILTYVFLKPSSTNTTNNNVVINQNTTNTNEETTEVKALCLKTIVGANDRITFDLFEECDALVDEVLTNDGSVDLESSVYYSTVNAKKGDTFRLEDLYWEVEEFKPGDKRTLFSYDSGIDLVFTNDKITIKFENNSQDKEQVIFNEEEFEYASIYEANATSHVTLLIKGKSGSVRYVNFLLDADQDGNTLVANISSGKLGITDPKYFCAVDMTDYSGGIPAVLENNGVLAQIMDFE